MALVKANDNNVMVVAGSSTSESTTESYCRKSGVTLHRLMSLLILAAKPELKRRYGYTQLKVTVTGKHISGAKSVQEISYLVNGMYAWKKEPGETLVDVEVEAGETIIRNMVVVPALQYNVPFTWLGCLEMNMAWRRTVETEVVSPEVVIVITVGERGKPATKKHVHISTEVLGSVTSVTRPHKKRMPGSIDLFMEKTIVWVGTRPVNFLPDENDPLCIENLVLGLEVIETHVPTYVKNPKLEVSVLGLLNEITDDQEFSGYSLDKMTGKVWTGGFPFATTFRIETLPIVIDLVSEDEDI